LQQASNLLIAKIANVRVNLLPANQLRVVHENQDSN
jgi:hypothetical protein